MKFESTLDIGDKAWVWAWDHVCQVTVGSIRIEHTDSKGDDSYSFGDNYKPQKAYKESYMCDETGVGSGTVYTMGEHIFKTKEEAEVVFAARIAEKQAERQRAEEYSRQEKLRRESYLRAQLDEIEKIKEEMK